MWTRKELKESAKDFLGRHYWKAFIVCLIVILLTSSHVSTSLTNDERQLYMENEGLAFMMNKTPIKIENRVLNFIASKTFTTPVIFIANSVFWFLGLVFILFAIFVGNILNVGRAGFFLKGFKGDVDTKNLWSYFGSGEYLNIVKTMFLRDLYNVLWTFLFIIPGIIKAYEYRMVPYILANESTLSPGDTITRSREMTSGHKWDIFVLDISFIGWDILGYVLFGLGTYFINPYKEATYAELYEALSGYDEIDDNIILE